MVISSFNQVSASGGIHKCISNALSFGANTFQIFTKSNRQWVAKDLVKKDVEEFKKLRKQHDFKNIFVHASYLINLGGSLEIQKKSTEALKIEDQRCKDLEIEYLILHPGSNTQNDENECLSNTSKNIDLVFEEVPVDVKILLENCAGQGKTMGHHFKHLKTIFDQSKNQNRLGFCLDTCIFQFFESRPFVCCRI